MNSAEFSEERYVSIGSIENCKADVIRVRKILRMVGSGKKVLDLGAAGNFGGEISLKIKKLGNEVFASDIADTNSDFFDKNGISFTKADLEKQFPYANDSFDVVVAGEIIEHLADTDSFIKEINRVLKNDGYVLITTPNVVSLGRRLLILLGRSAYFEASFSYPEGAAGHLRYYTYDLLVDYLKILGLRVSKRTSDVVSLPFGLSSALFANIFPSLGRSIIVKVVKSQ